MTPGARTIDNIAVYGSVTQFVILIHGLASKSATVLELDLAMRLPKIVVNTHF